jgi:hypothetical protein
MRVLDRKAPVTRFAASVDVIVHDEQSVFACSSKLNRMLNDHRSSSLLY